MLDFQNASYVKLRPVDNSAFSDTLAPMLIDNESIRETYKGLRDGVVFTNLRIITINVQGVTGKKKDFTSLPYSKVQAYSIETAGVLDIESELELYFSELGHVHLEFAGKANVAGICRMISEHIL